MKSKHKTQILSTVGALVYTAGTIGCSNIHATAPSETITVDASECVVSDEVTLKKNATEQRSEPAGITINSTETDGLTINLTVREKHVHYSIKGRAESISSTELKEELKQALLDTPDIQIIICAERSPPYEAIKDLLNTCNEAGVQNMLFKVNESRSPEPQAPASSEQTRRPRMDLSPPRVRVKKSSVPKPSSRIEAKVEMAKEPEITSEQAKTMEREVSSTSPRFYIDLVKDEQGLNLFTQGKENPVSLEELKSIVQEQIRSDPDTQIILRGNEEASFTDTKSVMKACAEIGAHKLIFSAKENPQSKAN